MESAEDVQAQPVYASQTADRDPPMLQPPRPCMQAAARACNATAAGAAQPRTCSAASGGRGGPVSGCVVGRRCQHPALAGGPLSEPFPWS